MSKILKSIIGIISCMPSTENRLAKVVEPPCGLTFKARVGKGQRKKNRKHRWE